MKFPFDFSFSFIFRLIFPGMVLATVFWPVMAKFLSLVHIAADASIALPVAAVVLGWLVVLADQPIYMLYEGRRWWPNKWRMKRIDYLSSQLSATLSKAERLERQNDSSNVEEYIKTLDFPFGENGKPIVRYPTRLGNIVEAYETYSESAYGIDAIFYWPRIWVMLDKDLRSTLDESQAIADGALYVSFCLLISTAVAAGYAVGGWLSLVPGWWLFDLPDLPSPVWTSLTTLLLPLAAWMIYELGLWQQRVYGELFKALFDQFRDKLDFATDAAQTAVTLGADCQRVLDNKYGEAVRYLRWHRIWPAGEPSSIAPEERAKTKRAQQKMSAPPPPPVAGTP